MSNECKQARNVVSTAVLLLATALIMISMSSCSSITTLCPAYASNKQINKVEL